MMTATRLFTVKPDKTSSGRQSFFGAVAFFLWSQTRSLTQNTLRPARLYSFVFIVASPPFNVNLNF